MKKTIFLAEIEIQKVESLLYNYCSLNFNKLREKKMREFFFVKSANFDI